MGVGGGRGRGAMYNFDYILWWDYLVFGAPGMVLGCYVVGLQIGRGGLYHHLIG